MLEDEHWVQIPLVQAPLMQPALSLHGPPSWAPGKQSFRLQAATPTLIFTKFSARSGLPSGMNERVTVSFAWTVAESPEPGGGSLSQFGTRGANRV